MHQLCNNSYKTDQNVFKSDNPCFKALTEAFPQVVNSISFKNKWYHNMFVDKLVVIFN